MFTRLPESNARRQRRAGGLAVSTAVHLVLVALAVRATAWSAPPKPVVTPVITVYREPVAVPTRPTPPTRRASGGGGQTVPNAPSVALENIPDLTIVPPDIPVAGSMSSLLDGDAFRQAGTRFGDGSSAVEPNVGDGPLEERFVEKAIIPLPGALGPRYPATLQSAGVEGEVRAQFVVDTLGHVEKGSVRILDSTHELFAAAVRDALTRARFKPAEAGGRKVRQLAEQAFTFRITR